MAGRRKGISSSDSELFRQSVGPVRKVRQDRRHLPARPVQHTHNPSITGDEKPERFHEIPDLGMGDILEYRGPGVQQRVLNRLKKGFYTIDGQLDLHGLTAAEGRKRLLTYLEIARHDGFRCIRIIHGKGHGSPGKKPVIKNMLNQALHSHGSVLAFCSAPVNDGGTGVAYVLLKRQGEKDVNDN